MKMVICGHFAQGEHLYDGQTVKTRNLAAQLGAQFPDAQIDAIDTYRWKRRPFRLIGKIIKSAISCRHAVILPAHNGVKIFVPLFAILSKICNIKVHYAVVGGWLPEYLAQKKWLIRFAKRLDCIYPETEQMRQKLLQLGLGNVTVMHNFKQLSPLDPAQMIMQHSEPFRVCTFSRVMKEKGISDIIAAVDKINTSLGRSAVLLDIYGPVEPSYQNDFTELLHKNQAAVCYKGAVEPAQSVDVIKDYFLLIFPTYYSGEGFPGTIIDAFSAGVPVLASNWRYNDEIIISGENGYLFEARDCAALSAMLQDFILHPDKINSLKRNCLAYAQRYLPETAVKPLVNRII